jgi:hypothetical protein
MLEKKFQDLMANAHTAAQDACLVPVVPELDM